MASAVVLKMDLHCRRCAGRIRKLIRSLYGYGVQDVWVSLETGHVVVTGPFLDASLLRWQIRYMTGKPVQVVSDGTPDEPDHGRMVHLGPPQTGYGGYYGGGGVSEYLARRQYVPNEAPVCFSDENPNGCCVM